MVNKIRKFIFDIMRRLLWDDYDPNEEFGCGKCGKQMYRRYLYCSNNCSKEFEKWMNEEAN